MAVLAWAWGKTYAVPPRWVAAGTQAAQRALGGEITVAAVDWQVPFGLQLHGVRWGTNPGGPPLFRLHTLRLRLQGSALWRGQVRLAEALIDQPEVHSGPPNSQAQRLWRQLGAKDASATPAEASGPTFWQRIPFCIDGARLRDGRIDWQNGARHWQIEGLGAQLQAQGQWAAGHASLNIGLHAATAGGPAGPHAAAPVAIGPARLRIGAVRWAEARWALEAFEATWGQSALQSDAKASWTDADGWQAQGTLAGHVDLTPWAALGVLPAKGAPYAGGVGLSLRAHVDHLDARTPKRAEGAVALRLTGADWRVLGVPLQGARLQARLKDGLLSVDSAELTMARRLGQWRAEGQAHLSGDGKTLGIGEHHWGLQAIGLRPAALTAWRTKNAQLPFWPKRLSASLQVHGEQAWPTMRGHAQLRASASPGARWPHGSAPLALTAHAEAEPQGWAVTKLHAALGHQLQVRGAARWPANARASWHGWLTATGEQLDGWAKALPTDWRAHSVRLQMALAGSPKAPTASGRLHVHGLGLRQNGHLEPLGELNMPFALAAPVLTVTNATLRQAHGEARWRGRWQWPQPSKSGSMAFAAPPFGGPLGDVEAEIGLFQIRFPTPGAGVWRLTGQAVLGGPVSHPMATGLVTGHAEAADQSAHNKAWLDASGAWALAWAQASPKGPSWAELAGGFGGQGQWRALAHYWPDRAEPLRLEAHGRQLPLALGGKAGQALARPLPLGFDLQAHGAMASGVRGDGLLSVGAAGWLRGRGAWRPTKTLGAWWAPWRGQIDGTARLSRLGAVWPALSAWRPGGELFLHAAIDPSAPGEAPARGELTWRRPMVAGQRLAAGDLTLAGHNDAWRGVQATLRAHNAPSLDAQARWIFGAHGAQRLDVQLTSVQLADLYPPLRSQEAFVSAAAEAHLEQQGAQRRLRVRLMRAEAQAGGGRMALLQPSEAVFANNGWAWPRLDVAGSAGRLSLRANARGPSLNAQASGHVQLGFVRPFVPALRQAEGELAFAGEAHGSSRAPRYQGEVRVARPVMLSPRDFPSDIRIERGRLRYTGPWLLLEEVAGEIDGGTFACHGQWGVANGRWGPYALTLQANNLPVHAGPVVAESHLALQLQGEPDRALLQGDIDIVSGRFLRKFELRDFNFLARSKNLDVPLSRRAPWLKNVQLDLRAKNKGGFDVGVDAGAFRLATVLQSDLHIGGNALAPVFNGKIAATEGALRFPHGTLIVHQASVDFDPARQNKHNTLGAEIALLAEGEVTPMSASSGQSYDVSLRLDGSLDNIQLDLSSDQGLGKMDVLSLLTTGHADVRDLAQSGDETAKLDAAIAFAGSQVADPLTQMAQRLLERQLNVQLELNSEITQGNVRVTAAKNLHRRLRLETAYSHGLTAEQSNVTTRAQLSFTDRLVLEGRAGRDLSGASSTASVTDHSLQSNLELKLRLLGD